MHRLGDDMDMRPSVLQMLPILVLAIVGTVVVVWPAARICKRAGHPWWFGIGAVIPLLNVALLWYIALSPWNVPPSATPRA
jgi:hypothetical protein